MNSFTANSFLTTINTQRGGGKGGREERREERRKGERGGGRRERETESETETENEKIIGCGYRNVFLQSHNSHECQIGIETMHGIPASEERDMEFQEQDE